MPCVQMSGESDMFVECLILHDNDDLVVVNIFDMPYNVIHT